MTTQTLANFNGKELPIIEHANDAWITSRHIGESLGYAKPSDGINKIYERNKKLLDKYSTTVNMGVETNHREARIFNEEGVMIITMKSDKPKANEFIEWAVSVLKAYRHKQPTLGNPHLEQQLAQANQRAELLSHMISEHNPEWKRIKRYFNKNLNNREIGKLLDMPYKKVAVEKRKMEACGIIQPPKNLAKLQSMASNMRLIK